MTDAPRLPERHRARGSRQAASGFAIALVVAFSAYLLFTWSRAGSAWFASVWFLALLPAVLCALICYVGDPDRVRSAAFYWLVPPALCALVCAGSVLFLHEGVICLVMLTPIWLVSGWLGFWLRAQAKTCGSSLPTISMRRA